MSKKTEVVSDKNIILKHYMNSVLVSQVGGLVNKYPNIKLKLLELSGSLQSLFFAAIYKTNSYPFLFLAETKEEASYIFSDLEELFLPDSLFFYPASFHDFYQFWISDNDHILLRNKVWKKCLDYKNKFFIVAYLDSCLEQVITSQTLNRQMLTINCGEKISIDVIHAWLIQQDFHRVDCVTSPREFSIRGSILDIFSFSDSDPFRIEFFNEKIDSLRSFNILSQNSLEKFETITLIPSFLNPTYPKEEYVSFFNILPKNTCIFLKNGLFAADYINNFNHFLKNSCQKIKSITRGRDDISPKDLFITQSQFVKNLESFTVIEGMRNSLFHEKKCFFLKNRAHPIFNHSFRDLIEDYNTHDRRLGYIHYLYCSHHRNIDRFSAMKKKEISLSFLFGNFYSGFIDDTHKLVCYTDHEVFKTSYVPSLHNKKSRPTSSIIKSLSMLNIGDYVIHIDHGIGQFLGLKIITVNGKVQETIKIIYHNNDALYVSIHALYKISKFREKNNPPPNLSKLGSPVWKKFKKKTKTRVKKLAFDLIQLYAKRKVSHGFAFSPDTSIQNELESNFLYEETSDQLRVIQEVKSDMESHRPMDRLICGDVGFGKTEVAMRAIFKAITDSKQVALLVPTTILVCQHHRKIIERFKDFPISIDYLNRFRSSSEKKYIFKNLRQGKIDLIIGTHQLINKNIHFKDLGLIIIDEEHKFGVAVKDRLKMLYTQVDTLSLTATPIPRTLQFSLILARDLSIIQTPPPNRCSIQTRLIRFDPELIQKSILYELSRNGQVFFIHNNVSKLPELFTRLHHWLPNARISIAHGQMESKKLESIMIAFIEGEIDILLSTTIIESGLDIPTVNTVFIYQAQNFGLADLHQIRGRVGRSSIQAFCYLITPNMDDLSKDAKKRLQTIEKFSDLGSGFHIAMQDLDMRGAGNLFGGEQSGFISEIGFNTYQKILNEAIEELKDTECPYLETKNNNSTLEKVYISDVHIDTDIELFFPSEYVNSTNQRLELYQLLSCIDNEKELDLFRNQLQDRFGRSIPLVVEDLLRSIRLKFLCIPLGFEKILLKQGVMLLYFISNPQSSYYQSNCFHAILNGIIHRYPQEISIKQGTKKNTTALSLHINQVITISQAITWLERLTEMIMIT